jgi:hypothetical protein
LLFEQTQFERLLGDNLFQGVKPMAAGKITIDLDQKSMVPYDA